MQKGAINFMSLFYFLQEKSLENYEHYASF